MKVLIWLIAFQLLRPSSELPDDEQFNQYLDKGMVLFDKTIAAIGQAKLDDFVRATTAMQEGYGGQLTSFTEAMWMVVAKKQLNKAKLVTVKSKLQSLVNEIDRLDGGLDGNMKTHLQEYSNGLRTARTAFAKYLEDQNPTVGNELSVAYLMKLELQVNLQKTLKEYLEKKLDRPLLLTWTKWYVGTIILRRIVYAACMAIEYVDQPKAYPHDAVIEVVQSESNREWTHVKVYLDFVQLTDKYTVKAKQCGVFNISLFCEDGGCCNISCGVKQSLGYTCRPKSSFCDVAEHCDGGWSSCAPDEHSCAKYTYIGVAVGLVLLFLVLGIVAFFFLRKRAKAKSTAANG